MKKEIVLIFNKAKAKKLNKVDRNGEEIRTITRRTESW